jgi:hypothetical protein
VGLCNVRCLNTVSAIVIAVGAGGQKPNHYKADAEVTFPHSVKTPRFGNASPYAAIMRVVGDGT